VWRLVFAVTDCAIQATKIAKMFACPHVLRPVGDLKLVHGWWV